MDRASGRHILGSRLAEDLDPADIARRALASDIVVAPGNVFGRSQSACNFLGFNVSQCAEPRIFKMIAATIGK
jgi:DNA-binding transcriptional MocR family regulator